MSSAYHTPPVPFRAPAPHQGKRIASAVLSSVLVLFGLVFAPMGILFAISAEPMGEAWTKGSNPINVVFSAIFALAVLVLATLGAVAVILARLGRSTGLLIYASVVTGLLLVGAIGLIVSVVITVSG